MDTVSFLQPEVQRCPFPFIERLQKAGPVYHDPLTNFNVVTHYDDIVYVNEHPELFSNTTSMITGKVNSPIAAEIAKRYTERGFLPMHTLVTADPPEHTGYRALVDKVCSPCASSRAWSRRLRHWPTS
jgi:cytochrome P450